ncbi:VOC family protein [Bacillus sp. EAC]|uniref:VOC family protein n=1 Tax=Bacillus sp. EAC TaxID=1978338 RepID=UPI000B42EFF8|nr:VOC family protein [Bacillus sp. EAC]
MNGILDIVLFCADTNLSKEWYEKVGFEFLRGHDHMYWYKVGHGELMLHPSDEKNSNADAVFQFVVDDISSLFKKIIDKELTPLDFSDGIQVLEEPTLRPWGYKEFCLRDPDGYIWAFVEK